MRKTASDNPERTDTKENRKLILKHMGNKHLTINEIIDSIFRRDIENGKVSDRTWKFYNHLNKLFSPMQKEGIIEVIGVTKGPTKRNEKIWRVKND